MLIQWQSVYIYFLVGRKMNVYWRDPQRPFFTEILNKRQDRIIDFLDIIRRPVFFFTYLKKTIRRLGSVQVRRQGIAVSIEIKWVGFLTEDEGMVQPPKRF
jgi:hypothetical protein